MDMISIRLSHASVRRVISLIKRHVFETKVLFGYHGNVLLGDGVLACKLAVAVGEGE